jgi:UDP-N-acetylmuramate: L-alanyl-gamma-D-glutamyl-meso-diaminopimelate ligase
MASLAGMLKVQGHEVIGSDQGVYPPMSDLLRELGIEVRCPYDEKNLTPAPDLVVIGNVISRGNPEAEAVLSRGISYLSMPQALNQFFLRDKTSLVVAGTHGKTTTTSLLAWVLESAGRSPSFFVGGKPKNFPQNFQLGNGPYFILEGDEYDTAFFDKGPKFLHYNPQHVLLTSVEFDHADIYRDLDHVLDSFRKLLQIIPSKGSLIVNLDYPAAAGLLKGYSGKVVTYAMEEENRDRADYFGEVVQTGEKLRFCVLTREQGKECCHHEVEWGHWGRYNVSNALGVTALAFQIGLDWREIHGGLVSFQGVKRRQELLGEARGVTVLDDFAHHPTAVRETLAGIRERFPGRRLWAIFEPRSNTSKRDIFQKDYSEAFSAADRVILADVFMPEKVKEGKVLDVDAVVSGINRQTGSDGARHVSGVDAIVELLLKESKSGDVFLFMSNGDFGGIGPRTLKALASKK